MVCEMNIFDMSKWCLERAAVNIIIKNGYTHAQIEILTHNYIHPRIQGMGYTCKYVFGSILDMFTNLICDIICIM